jgi:hypothetical protein
MSLQYSNQDVSKSYGISRRTCIGGLVGAAAGSTLLPGLAHAAEGLDVTTHGADPTGQKDSTQAFRDAFKQSRSIYVPAGTFLVGGLELPDSAKISGAGESSILKQAPRQRFVLYVDSGRPDPNSNLTKMHLQNIQLRGTCDTDGFAEQIHLVSLNGVSDVAVEGVVFRGFRGDGLYVGSGLLGGQERHNARVAIHNCVFDGINNENRNAISIVDGADVFIENCQFVNVSRPNMPGAIDIEPNASAFAVVRNIHITRNTLTGIGGKAGAIGLYVPIVLRQQALSIVIEENTIENARGNAFLFSQPAGPSPGDAAQLLMRKNTVNRCAGRPVWLQGVSGALIVDNHFTDAGMAALVGGERPRDMVRGVEFKNNVFDRCGNRDAAGVQVYSVDGLHFERNQWTDCGDGSKDASVVQFIRGSATHVSFAGNTFASPGHKSTWAVKADPGFQFTGKNVSTPDNQRRDGLNLSLPVDAGLR